MRICKNIGSVFWHHNFAIKPATNAVNWLSTRVIDQAVRPTVFIRITYSLRKANVPSVADITGRLCSLSVFLDSENAVRQPGSFQQTVHSLSQLSHAWLQLRRPVIQRMEVQPLRELITWFLGCDFPTSLSAWSLITIGVYFFRIFLGLLQREHTYFCKNLHFNGTR